MEYGPGEAFQSLTIQSGHFVGSAKARPSSVDIGT
jgi:hypothetical protein